MAPSKIVNPKLIVEVTIADAKTMLGKKISMFCTVDDLSSPENFIELFTKPMTYRAIEALTRYPDFKLLGALSGLAIGKE